MKQIRDRLKIVFVHTSISGRARVEEVSQTLIFTLKNFLRLMRLYLCYDFFYFFQGEYTNLERKGKNFFKEKVFESSNRIFFFYRKLSIETIKSCVKDEIINVHDNHKKYWGINASLNRIEPDLIIPIVSSE